jgi:hypothetical protein
MPPHWVWQQPTSFYNVLRGRNKSRSHKPLVVQRLNNGPIMVLARRIHRWGALILLTAACHAHRGPDRGGGDQYLIMATELVTTRHNNLYEAVRQLRPQWFTRNQRRGTTPSDRGIMLYIDDRPIGNAGDLRNYPVTFPARVRYMSVTEAQVRFGQVNNMRPAILIETERH